MEFLVIGDSKLKIVLTEEDMRTYNLDGNIDAMPSGYRRAFWRVLDAAKEEVGFDPEGDKILIQFYPLKSGGCEVFVTKLGILSKESAKMVTRSEHVTMLSRTKSTYSFENKKELVAFITAFKRNFSPPYPNIEAYKTQSARYYLLIEEFSKDDGNELPLLFEYAKPLNSDIEYFVTEHLERLNKSGTIEEVERLI